MGKLRNTLFVDPATLTSINVHPIKSSSQISSPPPSSFIHSPLPHSEIVLTTKSENNEMALSETECQTPYQCCCREKGVVDMCWGYCVDIRDKKYTSRSLAVRGICYKWLSIINYCTYCSHAGKDITL